MTELKKITEEIYNEYYDTLTMEEMFYTQKEISDEQMKDELLKRGFTKERCFSEPHDDVNEEWLNRIFA